MAGPQSSLPELPPRATLCPKCQSRMAIQRIVPGREGFEHWTLRCTKCGTIREAQVNADPMKSEALGGWFDGELKPPE
jgi:transcription elongation factor Elf1